VVENYAKNTNVIENYVNTQMSQNVNNLHKTDNVTK